MSASKAVAKSGGQRLYKRRVDGLRGLSHRYVPHINIPGILASQGEDHWVKHSVAYSKHEDEMHNDNMLDFKGMVRKFTGLARQIRLRGFWAAYAHSRQTAEWNFGDQFGTLMGVDKMGNRYFENLRNQKNRTRWVEYADKREKNPDATMIAPEWHGWMHYRTDVPPGHPNFPAAPYWVQKEQTVNPSMSDKRHFPRVKDAVKTGGFVPWSPDSSSSARQERLSPTPSGSPPPPPAPSTATATTSTTQTTDATKSSRSSATSTEAPISSDTASTTDTSSADSSKTSKTVKKDVNVKTDLKTDVKKTATGTVTTKTKTTTTTTTTTTKKKRKKKVDSA